MEKKLNTIKTNNNPISKYNLESSIKNEADLANLFYETALWAARLDKETVGNEDFKHASD